MTHKAELFIDSRCDLAEGPIWHPARGELLWFDILQHTLFRASPSGEVLQRHRFPQPVAAAGVIDRDTVMVAMAGALLRLDLVSGEHTEVTPLEADKPGNRTNDSRVHPSGAFWIGTMSRRGGEEKGAGAVYLYRQGQIEKLLGDITVPNSICFSPDGRTAYFTDTPTEKILKCSVEPETGRPVGEWTLFADTSGHRGFPDGSVVDAEGYLWNARWQGNCVVRHAPDGSVDRIVEVGAPRVTCPCFGGPDLKTLYITTAREGMSPQDIERDPFSGSIFAVEVDVPGQAEPTLLP